MIYERCMYFLYSRRCLGVMFILASNKWHAGMPAHFTGVNVSYGAPLCFLSTLFDRSFPVTLAKRAPTVCIVACIEHRSVRNLRTTFFDQVILLKWSVLSGIWKFLLDLKSVFSNCMCTRVFFVSFPYIWKWENLFSSRMRYFSVTFD